MLDIAFGAGLRSLRTTRESVTLTPMQKGLIQREMRYWRQGARLKSFKK
jgi:hypothetical protein